MAKDETKTEEMNAKLIAEVRLFNANEALESLKREIAKCDNLISDKDNEINNIQEENKDARQELAELHVSGEELQKRKQNGENRLIISKATPDETQAKMEISTIFEQIRLHDLEFKAAAKRRDNAETALADIPVLQEELTRLHRERDEKQNRYDEMYILWQEQYRKIGIIKMQDLRDDITTREENIAELEAELVEAKRQLKSTQMSIKDKLYKWPEHSQMLQATHGFIPPPQIPEEHIFTAWLNLMDMLREYGGKMHQAMPLDETPRPARERTNELLSLNAQEILYYSFLQNWQLEEVTDKRGHIKYVWMNKRTKLIRVILERIKEYPSLL